MELSKHDERLIVMVMVFEQELKTYLSGDVWYSEEFWVYINGIIENVDRVVAGSGVKSFSNSILQNVADKLDMAILRMFPLSPTGVVSHKTLANETENDEVQPVINIPAYDAKFFMNLTVYNAEITEAFKKNTKFPLRNEMSKIVENLNALFARIEKELL